MRQNPGEFMVDRAEDLLPEGTRNRVPETAEAVVAQGLGMGYGATCGAAYAALCPQGGSALIGGALLGLGTWLAGCHGWLPALGLTPPLHEQTSAQIAGPIGQHLAYGVVTAVTYDWLQGQFDPAVPAERELA